MIVRGSASMNFRRLAVVFLLSLAGSASASHLETDFLSVSSIRGRSGASISISSDVVQGTGNSLTLSGSSGSIITASSVTAASFWGDGRHLSGLATNILLSTQVFSGANTFGSSFTVRSGGRAIVLSTSSSVSNLKIDSSGTVSFFPELHNSSSTMIPQAATSSSQLGPCVSGSTLTIRTSGGRIEVLFAGVVSNVELSSAAAVAFLQDGSFVGQETASRGAFYGQLAGNTWASTSAFRYLLDAPSPGNHSYCLTIAAPSGGTAQLQDGSTSIRARNLFFVLEVK